MTEKAKQNAQRRKERGAEMIRERQLVYSTLLSVLEDPESTRAERLRAIELLKSYNL